MRQPEWDKYETALLIEGYNKIENNELSRRVVVAQLSETLRKLGMQRGLQIDDIYRNTNGINLRLSELKYLFTEGKSGVKNTSHLFEHMVFMYQHHSESFNGILSEAKELLKLNRTRHLKKGKTIRGWTCYYHNDGLIRYKRLNKEILDDEVCIAKSEKKCSGYAVLDATYETKEEEIAAIRKRLLELLEKEDSNLTRVDGKDKLDNTSNSKDINDDELKPDITNRMLPRSKQNDSEEMTFSQSYNMEPTLYALLNIDDFELSIRVRKRLDQAKIYTIADLLNTRKSMLASIKGFGVGCFNEIDRLLNNLKSPDFKYSVDEDKYTIEEEIRPFVEKIKSGDFGFVETIGFSERTKAILYRYEEAYQQLGVELVGKAVSQDQMIIDIRNAFYDYSLSYVQKEYCRKTISEKLNKERKKANAERVLKGFVKDEDTLTKYTELISDADQDISDFIVSNAEILALDRRMLLALVDWCNFDINDEIKSFFYQTVKKERSIDVIRLRASGHTLEEIGNEIGVTRERVRQIEKKVVVLFRKWQQNRGLIYQLLIALNEENIFTPLEILDIESEYGVELIYLLKNCDIEGLSYDKQLGIFVFEDASLVEKVQAFIDSLPDTFDEDEFRKIIGRADEDYGYPENIVSAALDDSYKRTGRVYHRSKLTLEKLYIDIIQKYYPEGIHIYSEHEGIRLHALENYGIDLHEKSDHAIESVIGRVCILRGRGVYKVRDNTTKISDSLAQEIYDYIEKSPAPIFMTNTIFTIFEDQLLMEGIDNKYYLQGLLKDRFGEKWIFRRDYISKDENYTTIGSSIVERIRKSQYPVKKEELQRAFPGVTDIVMSFATSEAGIINLFGEYLHGHNLRITRSDKTYLKSVIEECIQSKGFCTGHEIYNCVTKDYPELLTKNFIKIPYGAFSLAEYLFSEEYSFSRPFIIKNDIKFERPTDVLKEMVKSSDIITIEDILSFAKDNRIIVYSQLEFLDSFNTTHLLIDGSTLASIEYIGITEEAIRLVNNRIKEEVVKTIPISQLECVSSLPKINVPWNSWLIYSIIKKWSTDLAVAPSNNQFRKAVPLVTKKGLSFDYNEESQLINHSGKLSTADDMDKIDDLIEDYLDEMLEGLDEL